ncbi:protein LMBR1L isoform X2 [Suricata suricatta]|uniref:Limb development membrane protein 1 like n=1 Tax=Suricata suricatta TaxID=37032 RepID=A0A673TR50_SURSU|nr:protein LMBR1L isoform X2 [Suricata suricatta]
MMKMPQSTRLRLSSAPLHWRLPWVLSCSCPSPLSATRCCSHCLATTISSGSMAPSSMASGTSFFSSPTCPSSSLCPLRTSSLSLRALLALERPTGAKGNSFWNPLIPEAGRCFTATAKTRRPEGVLGRVYETVVMLMLLTLLVLGMVWVASAIVDDNKASRESLYDFWEYYLPYLYSCISFLGVLLLLVCTPLGLARMFSVTGKLLVKPRLLEDLEEQLYCSAFEEAALTRRICNPTSCWLHLDMELLHRQVLALQTQRVLLEKRRKASAWQRNLGYPLAMLCLLVLTGLSVLIVAIHILELLIDEAAMPRGMQDASLGQVSFSKLGSFGAVIQVVLIFYLMVSSVVGFYSSPLFRGLRPRGHDTAMTQIIGNCVCLLVLSSALPVFSRTLGLTRFDLLGDFGRFNWLGNFYIVFLYNAAFAGLTTLCLVKTFTAAVRAELIRAFGLDRLPLPVSGFPRASRKTQHQ